MIPKTKVCPQCGEEKSSDEFYRRKEGASLSSYCKSCTNIQAVVRQRALKQKAVEYKGGSCQICGYDKYIGALEFHHIEPSKKDFTIAQFRSYSFKKLQPELDKCLLVCANCHRELHEDNKDIVWSPDSSKIEKEDIELDSYQQPKRKSKIEWLPDKELKELVWEYPRTHLSKVLNVSDGAIARYLKRRGIEQPPRGYWAKLRAGKL